LGGCSDDPQCLCLAARGDVAALDGLLLRYLDHLAATGDAPTTIAAADLSGVISEPRRVVVFSIGASVTSRGRR
jgi:hypothetical protein